MTIVQDVRYRGQRAMNSARQYPTSEVLAKYPNSGPSLPRSSISTDANLLTTLQMSASYSDRENVVVRSGGEGGGLGGDGANTGQPPKLVMVPGVGIRLYEEFEKGTTVKQQQQQGPASNKPSSKGSSPEIASSDGYIYKVQTKQAHGYFPRMKYSNMEEIQIGDFVKIEADRGGCVFIYM